MIQQYYREEKLDFGHSSGVKGEPLAVKRPKQVTVKRKNWKFLTVSRKKANREIFSAFL